MSIPVNLIESSFTNVFNFIQSNLPTYIAQMNTVDSFVLVAPSKYAITNTEQFSAGTNLTMNYVRSSNFDPDGDNRPIGIEVEFFISILVNLGFTNSEIAMDTTLKRYMDVMYNLFRADSALGGTCDIAMIMDSQKLYDEDFTTGKVDFACKYIIAF